MLPSPLARVGQSLLGALPLRLHHLQLSSSILDAFATVLCVLERGNWTLYRRVLQSLLNDKNSRQGTETRMSRQSAKRP
ncbi:hypothetical protein BJY04DRAFT_199750 [Aspergillus karnatakaensis]|uniref:uncharacterized protein n=1 Tax=Aspergillus karnatakaensis TaxID=1810916 RepID=UPI003CCC9DC9